MQMLKKIFNSENKYFLELDEIKESKPVQAAIETAEKVTDAVQDKATEVIESKPVQTAVKTAKEATSEAQDKIESATKTETKPQAESKTNSNKQVSKKTDTQTASPQDSGASSFEQPFWVAAMYNNNSTTVNSDGTQAEPTFATDHLMPVVTKYRRRPGPSLNKFKDMASKAKTPKG